MQALTAFHSEVTAQNFPYPQNSIGMKPGEKDTLFEALDKALPVHR